MVTEREVAPFAGAWIEMQCCYGTEEQCSVAPFAGAWIEIMIPVGISVCLYSRSLRGSVD